MCEAACQRSWQGTGTHTRWEGGIGKHIFVCSEVVLENGERITADFLTVKINGAYQVVEVIMNNRDRVKGMMKDK